MKLACSLFDCSGDLDYLVRKFNLEKRRHVDDMIATRLKIEEWNKQGTNQAFLFKEIGKCNTRYAEFM